MSDRFRPLHQVHWHKLTELTSPKTRGQPKLPACVSGAPMVIVVHLLATLFNLSKEKMALRGKASLNIVPGTNP